MVGKICDADVEHNHMPDYAVRLDQDDMVVFVRRSSMPRIERAGEDNDDVIIPELRPETFELARHHVPGWVSVL